MSKWICVDDFEPDTEWSEYEDGFISYSRLQIDSAPSIDIVRCGECIYWKNSLCQAWHRIIPKDGYCSIGEREGE